jgi:hypothetical protein
MEHQRAWSHLCQSPGCHLKAQTRCHSTPKHHQEIQPKKPPPPPQPKLYGYDIYVNPAVIGDKQRDQLTSVANALPSRLHTTTLDLANHELEVHTLRKVNKIFNYRGLSTGSEFDLTRLLNPPSMDQYIILAGDVNAKSPVG